MTSSIVLDSDAAAAAAQPTRPAPAPVAARLTFGGVLRSERIKLTSLRSIRITLLITVLLGLGLSTALALLFSAEMRPSVAEGGLSMFGTGDDALRSYLLVVGTFAAPFLALIFGVLGVFAISSEYSSGMILSTLTAVPRRTPVFAAKALVLAAVSGLTALVLVAGGLAVAIACLPSAAAQLGSAVVLTGALGTVVYLVLIALLAFGVAALLRSTAGGIAVITGLTFVMPIVFQVLSITGWEWVLPVSQYLPSQLGMVLTQGAVEAPSGPGYGVALAAMVIWAAAAVVPAAIAFKRRDAR